MKEKRFDKEKDSISMRQFVEQFLQIPNLECRRLRHCDLRAFESPFVVGVSNDYADKNPDLVKEGFLIIVIDCKKNRGTYINPNHLKEITKRDIVESNLKEIQKLRCRCLRDLEEYYGKISVFLDTLEEIDRFTEELKLLGKEKVLDKVMEHELIWDSLIYNVSIGQKVRKRD